MSALENSDVFVDEIQRRPRLIKALIDSVDHHWHRTAEVPAAPPAMFFAGTATIGTNAMEFDDHDLGKVVTATVPPFSALELFLFLRLLPCVGPDLSLGDVWTLWSFMGGIPDYIYELYATGQLAAVLKPFRDYDEALDPLVEKAKVEYAHVRQHLPSNGALEVLQQLTTKANPAQEKNPGFKYLQQKGLLTLYQGLGKQKAINTIETGFLRNGACSFCSCVFVCSC